MKQTKHALSIFLCLLMLFSCMVPAFAETNKRIIYYVAPPEGNLNVAVPETLDPSTDWDFLANAIHTLLYTSETEVDISSLNIPYSDSNVDSVYSFIWYEPTALRTKNVGYWTIQANGTRIIGGLVYNGDWAANLARYNQCLEAIDQLMYGIKDNNNLSQYEKCLLLHDRLAAWTEYDYANLLAKTVPDDSYSAYGPLVNRVAVCNGYALAYGWMLDILGIENYYTSSKTINHGWNKVILDGEAYYVDVTYDDPVWDVPGRVDHENLMIPFSTFAAQHDDATDYDNSPSSTKYENAFDKASDTETVFLNGKFYYIQTQYSGNNAALKSRDLAGNETVLKTIDRYYWVPNANGGSSGKPYMPKMTAIGNTIIYTAPREVRAYNVVTGQDSLLFTPKESIYAAEDFRNIGLQQSDGTVYVTAYNSTNFDENTKANYTDTYNYCNHTNKVTLEKTVGPDCKTAGDLKEICADCRAMFKTPGGGDKGDHNYQATGTTAATCTAQGYTTYTCTACGDSYNADYTAMLPHDWEWVTDTPATCGTAGSKHEKCKTCTATQSLNTVIPATGSHSYTAQIVKAEALKSAATCTAPATYYYSCATCGKVENNAGHTFTSGSPAAHTFTAQTVKADALKAAASCTAAAVYYYSCVNCGKVEKNDSHTFMSGSATEHVWEWVIDKNATCVAAGSKHEKCKTCTATQSLNTVIPATGSHSYTAQTVKADALKSAATCTAPATYYYSCTTCGAIEKKAGHTFTSGSATAHVDANGDNRCDNCNKDLSEPQPEPQNLCKYCHKEHTGFFGKIVQFFHNILYSLTHLFKK